MLAAASPHCISYKHGVSQRSLPSVASLHVLWHFHQCLYSFSASPLSEQPPRQDKDVQLPAGLGGAMRGVLYHIDTIPLVMRGQHHHSHRSALWRQEYQHATAQDIDRGRSGFSPRDLPIPPAAIQPTSKIFLQATASSNCTYQNNSSATNNHKNNIPPQQQQIDGIGIHSRL